MPHVIENDGRYLTAGIADMVANEAEKERPLFRALFIVSLGGSNNIVGAAGLLFLVNIVYIQTCGCIV